MTKKRRRLTPHDQSLERITSNLTRIGEDPSEIEWVISEGIWLKDHSTAMKSLCDLIIIYAGDIGIPAELKGNMHQRGKALKQLLAGKEFIETELGLLVPYGKFIVYRELNYNVERIDYR